MGLPYWYLWALLFPLVRRAASRFPLTPGRWVGSTFAHLGIALGMTLVHSLLEIGIQHLLGARHGSVDTFTRVSFNRAFYFLPFNLGAYTAVLGVAIAIESSRRAREELLAAAALRTQLAEANLQALRAQLNPHFLFNAMNSIAMLVRRGENSRAVTMIAGLSELLRYVLEEHPAEEVALREELAFLRKYLEVEEARFPDRLRAEIAADPDTLDARVPSLVLQPLVENAIKHGVSRRAQAGRVRVTAARDNGRLVLRVTDDGPGPNGAATGGPESAGVGLRNVEARLRQLYGRDQEFTLAEAPGGGAVATVVLPYRVEPG
jgi:LytS/YehU family sensor histidine kinase